MKKSINGKKNKMLLDTKLGDCVRRIRTDYLKEQLGIEYENDEKKDILIVAILVDYLKYMFYAAMYGFVWNIPNMLGRFYVIMEKINKANIGVKHVLRSRKIFDYKFRFIIESKYFYKKKYYFNPDMKYISMFRYLLDKTDLAVDYFENGIKEKIPEIKF